MDKLKHEVHEEAERIRRRETFSAEIGAYEAFVTREGEDGVEVTLVSAMDRPPDEPRRPYLRFHPRNVEDLETMARELPDVLTSLAAMMREAGLGGLAWPY